MTIDKISPQLLKEIVKNSRNSKVIWLDNFNLSYFYKNLKSDMFRCATMGLSRYDYADSYALDGERRDMFIDSKPEAGSYFNTIKAILELEGYEVYRTEGTYMGRVVTITW